MRRRSWLLSLLVLLVLLGALALGGTGTGRARPHDGGSAVQLPATSCPTAEQCAPAPRPRPAESGAMAVDLAAPPLATVAVASPPRRPGRQVDRLPAGVPAPLLRPPQAARIA